MAAIVFNNGAADGGKWSTAGNWDLGRIPAGGAGGDDVTIPKNLTCVLDAAGLVAKSVTLAIGTTGSDVGGKLKASTTANSDLTVYNGITSNGSTGGTSGSYSSTVDLDMSTAAGYTCTVKWNGAATTGSTTYMALSGRFTLKGAQKTRWTTTTGAVTSGSSAAVHVSDATGWRDGDRIVFISTQAYNATPKVSVMTIASSGVVFDSGSTGAATITFTGTYTNNHATRCVVGNFTSNLVLGPVSAGSRGAVYFAGGATQNGTSVCDDVLFDSSYPSDVFRGGFGAFLQSGSGLSSFQRNAFYEFNSVGQSFNQLTGSTGTRKDNIFFTTQASTTAIGGSNAGTSDTGDDDAFVIFRSAVGVQFAGAGCEFKNFYCSGCTSYATQITSATASCKDGHFFGNALVYNIPNGAVASKLFERCSIGTRYSGATNPTLVTFVSASDVSFEDCPLDMTGGSIASGLTSCGDTSFVKLLNKGDGTETGISAAVQEVYRNTSNTVPVLTRDAAVYSRATSSLKMDFIGTSNTAQSWEVSIPARAAKALKILLCVRKNSSYGSSTLPTATLSGLGITPVTATMDAGTAADTWETLDISYAAGAAPSADGNLTLTLTGQSATNGAACYFSGMPIAPFVTRCRHYGYLFDETTATRTVNPTISASEATAIAYTGITVTWDATQSDTDISAAQTFQKLYDYTQADACLNVGSALPLTGAGVAGSPALFSAGDITVSTGGTLSGSGALSMGAYTLTYLTDFTYTGGTFAQAASTPSFDGGTVSIGAAGTYTFDTTGTVIVSMTPTATGTYAMGGVTASGQLDLRNTSGTHAITVELSAEAAAVATTANNTGAAITVSAPGLYQSVTVTGAIANSEIQVADVSYDFTVSGVTTAPVAGDTYTNNDITWTVTATDITAGAGTITAYGLGTPETSGDLTRTTGSGDSTIEFSAWARNVTTLYKGAPTFPYTWTDGAAAAAARAIRLRVAYCQGTVAKQMIESYIGVCGVSSGDAAIAYNAAQVGDATYNTWALDGPTILAGGNYTFTDASPDLITINAASVGATLGWPTLYAVTVAWLSSDDGIDDEIAYCVSPDPVNFIWENVRIKIPVGEAMAMTSGWGRDSVTGLGITLWDSTGGAISFDGPHTTGYPSGSGLDGGQSAELTSAAANAAAIKVAVDAYLDATISSRARPADVPSANDVAQEVVAGITF